MLPPVFQARSMRKSSCLDPVLAPTWWTRDLEPPFLRCYLSGPSLPWASWEPKMVDMCVYMPYIYAYKCTLYVRFYLSGPSLPWVSSVPKKNFCACVYMYAYKCMLYIHGYVRIIYTYIYIYILYMHIHTYILTVSRSPQCSNCMHKIIHTHTYTHT
jgi:hypothetical protein